MSKVRVNLTVDSELLEEARRRGINLSRLLTTVLQKGLESRSGAASKGVMEDLYAEFMIYRTSVVDYTLDAAKNWLEGRMSLLLDLGMDKETLAGYLESRYQQEMEEGEKRAKLLAKTGNTEEIYQWLYVQYKPFRGVCRKADVDDWIAYRKYKFGLPMR
ncbi:MAG: type II toxin-antitoxin system CcdA family antitoxin, partial [archaeon]|nr:type II toxin-antitoxin system CcdA family antitoxin [archaeon]